MGVSVNYLGFGIPLIFIFILICRAFQNRCAFGALSRSDQWKLFSLLLLEISILGVTGFLDVSGSKAFVIEPTQTSSGGVQVMNSWTGQVGFLIWFIIFLIAIPIGAIKMLPALFYTLPIFLVMLLIDFVGCSTYVERYQESCVIGGAGLCDGLMLIILIHFFHAALIYCKKKYLLR